MVADWGYTYNGLTFGEATKYGIIATTGISEPPDLREDEADRVGSDGGFLYSDQYNVRRIVITADVADTPGTNFEATIEALKDAFLPQVTAIPLVFKRPGLVQQRIYCKPSKLSLPMDTAFNLGYGQWSVMLAADDPLIYADTAGTITALAPAGTQAVSNAGSKSTRFETMTITGPGTNFTIKDNASSTKLLKLNTTLTGGQSITVDWKKRTIVKQDGTNLYSTLDPTSLWWPLFPGSTTVIFTVGSGSTGATKLDATWRSAWI